jgi:hypothetical protein
MYKSCTGLSLTFGYTNPWAIMLREQCDAWASVPSGTYQFLTVFLVDVPAAKCICKDSQGENFVRYATDVCFERSPEQMKPLIRAMIDAQGLGIIDTCDAIISHTISR